MSWPPMLMRIKIRSEKTNFGIWLPLFLLFPVALVFFLVLSPLILIGILVTWPSGWGKLAWHALITAFVACWSLRGFKVDVQGPRECVQISII